MSNGEENHDDKPVFTREDFIGIAVSLLLVVAMLTAGGLLGGDIAKDNVRDKICRQSGFAGYERVRDVDYCYVGEGIDVVLVPLLVTMPEEINDGR